MLKRTGILLSTLIGIFALVLFWPGNAFAAATITLDSAAPSCSGAAPQVLLSWTASDFGSSPTFSIFRKIQGEPTFGPSIGITTAITFPDTITLGLKSDEAYTYKIEADDGGSTIVSNELNVSAQYCASVLSIGAECRVDGPYMNLSWDAASGALDTYEVHRKAEGESVFTLVAPLTGKLTTITFDDGPNIEGIKQYEYFVKTIWQDAHEEDSNNAIKRALTCPSTLSLVDPAQCYTDSAPGGPKIELSWNALLGVNAYHVYRQLPGESSHTLLAPQGVLSGSATSFTDNLTETASNAYFQTGSVSYVVKAIWGNGQQADSLAQGVSIPQCPPFLTVQNNCKETGFRLSWTATQSADQYNVRRQNEVTLEFDLVIDGQISASFLDFPTDPTQVDGSDSIDTKKYRVDAVAGAVIIKSNEVEKSIDCTPTSDPPEPTPVLCPPNNAFCSAFCDAGKTRIQLGWTAADNVNTYHVHRQAGSSGVLEDTAITIGTSWLDTGLQSGIDYTYQVIAHGPGTGQTDFGDANPVTFTAVSCTPLPTPTIDPVGQCTVGFPEVKVTWTSAGTSVTQYEIQRGPSAAVFDFSTTFLGGLTPDPEFTAREWIDVNVDSSTPYYYRVIARGPDGVAEVTSSAEIVTTPFCGPATPSLSLVNQCSGTTPQVKVAWTSTGANTDHYELFRDGALWLPNPTTPGDRIDTLVAETLHTYRVDAVGPSGTTSSQNQSVVAYDCSLPGDFVLAGPTSFACQGAYLRPDVDLSWGQSSNATRYELERTDTMVSISLKVGEVSYPDFGFSNPGFLDFDGVDDAVNIGNILSGGATQLSAEAWVYTRTGGDDRVVAKSASSGPGSSSYIFSLAIAGTTVRVRLLTSGPYSWDGGTISLNTWHHIAFTYDGSNVRIYIDGAETASAPTSGSLPASSVTGYIGNNSPGVPRYWNGFIDEVRIYRRSLSADEVAQHYLGVFIDESDIEGLWHFDDGSGPTATDSSGNSNHGTLNGPTWVTANDALSFTDLGFGNALDFDGGDYIVIPDDPSLEPTSAITVAAWVNPTVVTSNEPIVNKVYSGSSDSYILAIAKSQLRWCPAEGGGGGCLNAGRIEPGQWYHVVGTFDSAEATDQRKAYINGVEVGSEDNSGNFLYSGADVLIGSEDFGSYFKGVIDEVHIYSSALSAGQVSALYNGTFNDDSSLVGQWHFDEDSTAQVVSDSSDNGNNGIRGSTPIGDGNDPAWVLNGPQSEGSYTWQAEAFGVGGSTFSLATTPSDPCASTRYVYSVSGSSPPTPALSSVYTRPAAKELWSTKSTNSSGAAPFLR